MLGAGPCVPRRSISMGLPSLKRTKRSVLLSGLLLTIVFTLTGSAQLTRPDELPPGRACSVEILPPTVEESTTGTGSARDRQTGQLACRASGRHALVTHDTTRYANNRADVSHQPTRQRERQMRGFTSSDHAQCFLHVHGIIQNLFRVSQHRLRSVHHRMLRARTFTVWTAATAA